MIPAFMAMGWQWLALTLADPNRHVGRVADPPGDPRREPAPPGDDHGHAHLARRRSIVHLVCRGPAERERKKTTSTSRSPPSSWCWCSLAATPRHGSITRPPRLSSCFDMGAKTASVVDVAGTEREVPIDDVHVGDRFVVRPGEKIATDGVVVEGASRDRRVTSGRASRWKSGPGRRSPAQRMTSAAGSSSRRRESAPVPSRRSGVS